MSDNTRIWNVLGTTDPKHTKSFNRAGGFKGTAVKPIYTDLKMTEMFGPCGIGWGMSEPQYQLVNGPEGEVAVYCWVSVWFVENGQRSEPVWGVGGDFAVKKNKYGLVADDEAFKKAFTDALGNAMKHLGMSADVHMGQFDDDKYVTALRREMDGNGDSTPPKPNGATRPNGIDVEAARKVARDVASLGTERFRQHWKQLTPEGREALQPILDELKATAEAADKQEPMPTLAAG